MLTDAPLSAFMQTTGLFWNNGYTSTVIVPLTDSFGARHPFQEYIHHPMLTQSLRPPPIHPITHPPTHSHPPCLLPVGIHPPLDI
jgi:hypothetical protein